jgi:putative ABC transport system permease protein
MHSTKIALLNLSRRKSRTAFALSAIAIAVAMTILMTSAGLGLKAGTSAAYVQEVDYWIIPRGSGVTDLITNSEQTMLGGVHRATEMILVYPDVNGASPVLTRVLYASDAGDAESAEGAGDVGGGRSVKAILGIGVIPGNIDVAPVSSGGFTPGDPDDTNEAVINEKTARLLGVGTGDMIYAGESQAALQPFKVVNVVTLPEYSLSPVIVLHLSELQEITGNQDGDRANEIIVSGGDKEFLESVYPGEMVLSNTELTAHNIYSDKRILATTIAVVSVSIVICILFVSTTMIMSVNEKQREFAVMRAIGISDSTIIGIVLWESVILSLAGGFIGALLSVGGRALAGEIGQHLYETTVPMVMPPMLLVGGVCVAVVAGVLSGIFPAILSRKHNIARMEG